MRGEGKKGKFLGGQDHPHSCTRGVSENKSHFFPFFPSGHFRAGDNESRTTRCIPVDNSAERAPTTPNEPPGLDLRPASQEVTSD